MATTLNHIGIALSDQKQVRKLFEILGFQKENEEAVPDQKVVTHFYAMPPVKNYLELLEPIGKDGPVSKSIEKRGPGIHHLSFLLDPGTLDQKSKELLENGFKLIYDVPKKGAHSMRINFIHPSTAGGMLIEIMERA